MSRKSTIAKRGVAGITALVLISAAVHAGVSRHNGLNAPDVDISSAALAAQQSVAGQIIEAELEYEDGLSVWEIDIVNESNQVMKIVVDGQSGQVLYTEADDDAAPDFDNIVRLDNAIDAIKALEGGSVVEAELEYERGELVWEIETLSEAGKESEYRVHAATGEILH